MHKNLPTGTVTFLFTDIEGSTKLAQDYAEGWEALQERHNQILRHAMGAQNGYVFRIIGDAFCAAFETAGEALRAALASQVELFAKNWEGPPVRVRMGIHTGGAEVQEDGDYIGYLTLTRVQRVMSAAHGGQILLSNTAAELVRNELPENVLLLDMREHRLKGLSQPEHLWQAVAAGLPQDFPPLQTLNDILNNLPMQLTSFIGREIELAEIQRALENHRLLTLTGPGGVGKTRLSIEIAARQAHAFRHGAWFIQLEHIDDPGLVPAAIAHVFNLQESAGRKVGEMLKDYLMDKALLLVLDNFEQVIDAAPLVKELLTSALQIKIMVTSRTALRVSGEYEYHVPLLPLPDHKHPFSLEQLTQLGSVQLFVERARSVKPDFVLTAENAPAVAETCQRLDGLPLAIELAAARVRVLPPQKMLGQLDHRLRFLVSSSRDLPARQQTLRAAISWSCDLLTPPEKLLFRRLAVFLGSATLDAIEFVCLAGEEMDVLTGLESLLDKNLIRQVEQDGEGRYEMLETIRDFADETLVASGEAPRIQARHLAYFRRMAQAAELDLVGPDELQWMVRLAREHDNLRAAILWGLKNDFEKAVEILCALALFWSRGGHNEEIIGWLRLALSDPRLNATESTSGSYRSLRARAVLTLGILALQQDYPEAPGTLQEAITLLRQVDRKADLAAALAFTGFLGDLNAARESVAIARTLDDPWTLAYCLVWQSQALRAAGGDLQIAQRSAAEGAQLSRRIGSEWAVARAVFSQGQLAVALGGLAEARAHFQECIGLFTRSQDRYHANRARIELAQIEKNRGRFTEAIVLYKAAILVWQDLGLQTALAGPFECLAMIAAAQGNFQYAAWLAGAAQRLRQQTASPVAQSEQKECDQTLEVVRTQLGEELFHSSLAKGQAMTLREAVACALALPATSTGRERH
jgi:predicted ATPase/class 3 adenylate cyclase